MYAATLANWTAGVSVFFLIILFGVDSLIWYPILSPDSLEGFSGLITIDSETSSNISILQYCTSNSCIDPLAASSWITDPLLRSQLVLSTIVSSMTSKVSSSPLPFLSMLVTANQKEPSPENSLHCLAEVDATVAKATSPPSSQNLSIASQFVSFSRVSWRLILRSPSPSNSSSSVVLPWPQSLTELKRTPLECGCGAMLKFTNKTQSQNKFILRE